MPNGFSGDAQQSWHTRMQSVIRQFHSLTKQDVRDHNGERMHIIGLVKMFDGRIKLTTAEKIDSMHIVECDPENVVID